MDLILWRHAEAPEPRDGAGRPRPRAHPQGRAPGAAHGRLARTASCRPARRVLVSPARRSQQTAAALEPQVQDAGRRWRPAPTWRRCCTRRAGPTRASRCWWSATSRRWAWRRPTCCPARRRPGGAQGRRLVAARPRARRRCRRWCCRRCWRPTAVTLAWPPRRAGISAPLRLSRSEPVARPGRGLLVQQVEGARVGLGPGCAPRPARPRGRGAQAQRPRVGLAARMALDDRQPQAQHLPGEGRRCASCGSILRRPPRWPSTRSADAPLLALREARRVDVGQQVGAVAVVVVVRDHQADLVQGAGPAQLAPRSRRSAAGSDAVVQAPAPAAHARRPARCRRTKRRCSSRTEASRMSAPARVALRGQRRSCRSKITPWRSAPLAGSARRCRSARPACTGWPARRRSTARRSSFRPGSVEPVDAPGVQAVRDHQRRPAGRDAAVGHAAGRSSCDTAPTVPDEPSASLPVLRRERLQRFLELGAGGDLGGAEALSVKRPSAK